MARIPRNYQGKLPTGRQIKDLLPDVMQRYEKVHQEKGHLLAEAWKSIVGEKIAHMTEIDTYEKGIVKIKVANSTLLSLFSTHEKERLTGALRKAFPSLTINYLHFFIG